MAAQQLLKLGDEHLLVFVADWAQPLVAGQHVVLAAALAHPHIAPPATQTQSERYTTLSLPLFPVSSHRTAPVPLYLQTAPLLMMRPSSALHRPQLRAGSAAHWLLTPPPATPPPPPPAVTLTTPLRRSAVSSARSRLKICDC